MTAIESSICDSEVARQHLLNEIDRLADVVQSLEARLHQVVISQGGAGKACSGTEPPSPIRSILADEIYNRAARISAITDRLLSLRNSLDL